MDTGKRIQVREPAPVNTVIDVVKPCDFLVCDFTYRDIIKHIASASVCDTHVFVFVSGRISLFQKIGIV